MNSWWRPVATDWLIRTNRHRAPIAALSMLAMSLICGCQSSAGQDPGESPASLETLGAVRQQITSSEPNAIVGRVIKVEQSKSFATVSDVPTRNFQEGEAIIFIDVNRKPLTMGIVRKLADDETLQVEWKPPGPGGRAPHVGDLGVRFN